MGALAHQGQIGRELAADLVGEDVAVGAGGKVPCRLAATFGELAFQLAEGAFQLGGDALQQGRAGVRGGAALANLAEGEDDFQLGHIPRLVGGLGLMPPFGLLRGHFALAVRMEQAHEGAVQFLEPLGGGRRRGVCVQG